ncbi:MAG: ABC transporter permease [Terriglobia bacterium]|jgi:putative ABC transport system permease protein
MRWTRFFRRRRWDEERARELEAYLVTETDENIARGMSPQEARYAAHRRLGNSTQIREVIYNMNSLGWLEMLWQDLRYALRMLARNPGFAAVAVITLGLGIGANTAIFSVVDAVLVRPLPFREPAQLLWLRETESAPGTYPLTGLDYLDWQAQTQTLQATSLFTWGESYNASGAGEPESADVVRTESNYFSVLGVAPILGRTFAKGEDGNHVAILSYVFWQRHFGGAKDAVGKELDLNGEKYTLVGVMPAWFQSPGWADIYVPMDMSPKNIGPRGQHQYRAIGRMKPGVSVAATRTELKTIAQRLEKQYPDSNSKVGAEVIPLKDVIVGDSRAELLIMLAAVGLVLLIGCSNVANLLLVRATGRHREIAVRRATGASRARILRQLLTESVVLSLLGAALGLLLGWGCLRILTTAEASPIPRPNPIGLNGTVLAFTLGVGLLVGILVGLAPALQVSQIQLNLELKSTVQAVLSPSGKRRILRDALVAGEIAISLALLTGAGLLLRSFVKLRELRLGIRPEGVVTAQIVLPPKKYATLEQAQAFFDQLLEGLKGAPGIKAAAAGDKLPLEGGSNGYITVDGADKSQFDNILVEQNSVTPDYFRALGIPFLAGRNFSQQDSQQAAATAKKLMAMIAAGKMQPSPEMGCVAIINQAMARQFWPNQVPLGKRYKFSGLPVTVIGIVGDVKEWGIRQSVIPQAYYPFVFDLTPPVGTVNIIVNGSVGTGEMSVAIRRQVHALDGSLALFRVRTMQEIISGSMSDASYQSLLLSSFALLALLLTAVGIYGVMAYAVSQRTHEIGIRMALGAHRGEILKLVLRGGAQVTVVGVVLGIAGALALTRFLANLLFGVQPHDPATFAAVAILLAAVALLACYIPARRATKVDPMVALRYE